MKSAVSQNVSSSAKKQLIQLLDVLVTTFLANKMHHADKTISGLLEGTYFVFWQRPALQLLPVFVLNKVTKHFMELYRCFKTQIKCDVVCLSVLNIFSKEVT